MVKIGGGYTKYVRNEDLKNNTLLKKGLSNRNLFKESHRIAIDEIKRQHKQNKKIKVLDVGCANGFFISKLLSQGIKNVEYCDIDDYISHNSVKKLGKLKDVNLNKENLPYKNESVDVVTCFGVYEHIENPYHVTREIMRILKKHGIMYLKIPYAMNIWERIYFLLTGNSRRWRIDDNHTTFYTYNTLEKMFIHNGFKIKKKCYTAGILPYLRLKLPATKLLAGGCLYVFKKKR